MRRERTLTKEFQANLRLYRSELKGIAILWVVFFHAQLGLSGVLGFIQQIGYGGVDLFFFLSGFGLYHSLVKDSEPRRYLLRRARRLLPAYLPFCCIWLCVMLPLYRFGTVQSLRTAAGNLFMLGFFANVPAMINWYISALALSLLLAPLMAGFLSQSARQLQSVAYLIVGLFAMGLCFIGTEQYMAIARLPIFALGMAAALPAFEDRKQKRFAPLVWLGFLLGMLLLLLSFTFFPEALNTYGMYWHPFLLIAPAICAGFCAFFHKVQKAAALFAPLRVIGNASFEIFLFNAWIEVLGKRFHLAQTPLEWLLWSIGSIAVGCLYHEVVKACSKRVKRT
ncbi:MAG: acyltransferase family protein [Clostridiales bacterium]|nr:acyltransferase family protein [Clostridiales bacterium]